MLARLVLGPCPISIDDTDLILGGSDLSDFFEPPKTPKRIKNSKRGNADISIGSDFFWNSVLCFDLLSPGCRNLRQKGWCSTAVSRFRKNLRHWTYPMLYNYNLHKLSKARPHIDVLAKAF